MHEDGTRGTMHQGFRMRLRHAACLVQHIKFAVQLPERESQSSPLGPPDRITQLCSERFTIKCPLSFSLGLAVRDTECCSK